MVAPIIDDNRDAIAALCRKYLVKSLWVFGSATSDAWDPDTSDIDFLVDLGDYEPGIADRFLDLADDLEAVMGRSIDIITVRGLANKPRLEQRINQHRVELYDAGRDRTAA
jgi:uncharacterized protein